MPPTKGLREEEKIRVGDRFEYGAGKGTWEITECLPGGVVWVMDRKRSLQGRRYQHEIRSALLSGSYKRLESSPGPGGRG